MMGEALTALASPDPHTRSSPRRCSHVLATMDTRAHCLHAPSPQRSVPRTEPAGAARGARRTPGIPSPPQAPRLLAEGDYPTPPRERILESQRQTWNSMSDLLLTASRDCGRKRWSINTYPLASANTTAERRGLLDFERWTQPSSNFNNY